MPGGQFGAALETSCFCKGRVDSPIRRLEFFWKGASVLAERPCSQPCVDGQWHDPTRIGEIWRCLARTGRNGPPAHPYHPQIIPPQTDAAQSYC